MWLCIKRFPGGICMFEKHANFLYKSIQTICIIYPISKALGTQINGVTAFNLILVLHNLHIISKYLITFLNKGLNWKIWCGGCKKGLFSYTSQWEKPWPWTPESLNFQIAAIRLKIVVGTSSLARWNRLSEIFQISISNQPFIFIFSKIIFQGHPKVISRSFENFFWKAPKARISTIYGVMSPSTVLILHLGMFGTSYISPHGQTEMRVLRTFTF